MLQKTRETSNTGPVYSFDVYDTVITRLVGRPQSLFLLLGYLLNKRSRLTISPIHFQRIRIHSEKALGRKLRRQVTLDEIYADLAQRQNWPSELSQVIKEAEVDLEKALAHRLTKINKRLGDARACKNSTVIFVSDMYLPKEVLASILTSTAVSQPEDRLFVSSDTKLTKASGKLFDHVAHALGVRQKDILHVGDDVKSDRRGGEKAGIKTILLSDAKLTRFERKLESYAARTCGLSSLLAGISRKIRHEDTEFNDEDQGALEVATGVAAPLLVAYVDWCLRRAHEANLQKLFFVSRDGQILLSIAEIIKERTPYRGEMGYIHGGRKAWIIPGLRVFDRDEIRKLINIHYANCTLRDFLKLCGVDLETVVDEMVNCLGETFDPDASIMLHKVKGIEEFFLTPTVKSQIKTYALQQNDLLRRYFSERGLSAECRWGFVETGWNGRLQLSLREALRGSDISLPHGFYLALRKRVYPKDASDQQCYLYDGNLQRRQSRLASFIAEPVEIFCSADHGPVTGFAINEKTQKVEPNFLYPGAPVNAHWFLPFKKAILSYASLLTAQRDLYPLLDEANLRACLSDLLTEFWMRPTIREAKAIGKFNFENGSVTREHMVITAPYSWKHLHLCVKNGKYPALAPSFWIYGAARLSPPLVVFMMDALCLLLKVPRFVALTAVRWKEQRRIDNVNRQYRQ